jgi:hypothetical protein
MPLMGMVFNYARHSRWFDVYVYLVLGCESGLCSRRFGGTCCHHLLGNFDSEVIDSILLQNFSISDHFHAAPAFDKIFFYFMDYFASTSGTFQLLIFDHLKYHAYVQFYRRHVLYIAYL